MSSFLETILEKTRQINPSDLHQHCFVFPSRRSGLIFRNHLVKQLEDHTVWSPSILSIEDFIKKYSQLKPAEELLLISELFNVYKKYDKSIQLDKFYSWGQVLLRDFDEVDRYLRDGRKLYTNLMEMREIDALFHDEESIEVIRKFRTVINESKTDLFAEFARTWEVVTSVYKEFSAVLEEKGLGYMGMLYKDVAEQDLSSTVDFAKVHFIGFNALSRSEEVIMEKLVHKGLAETYWNVHEHFMNDLEDHSGKFIREYSAKWTSEQHHWIYSEQKEQNINIYNSSGHVAQTQAACFVLQKEDPAWNQTALVLGDENLLMPLLYGLPGSDEPINITMGYPAKNHPIVLFIKNLIDLQFRIIRREEGGYVSSTYLLEFLGHPYVKIIGNNFQYMAMKFIRDGKREYTALEELRNLLPSEYAELLALHTESSVLKALKSILDQIFGSFNSPAPSVEKEVIYALRKHINQFEELLIRTEFDAGYDFLWKLLNESFSSLRVNFSGEPVKGLQIMGFLESRVLGYENLFLLSMNEGHMPRQRAQLTYIPYSLRKAFGLPTFEERDAIYGYHFKRLLFQAKNIHLFYNSELAYDGTGEMSRFLRQLMASDPSIRVFSANAPVISLDEVQPPVILKEKSVWNSMQKYLEGQTDLFEKPAKISPTALTTYIQCELKFYFRYVLGLKDQESDVLEMEPKDFGNLFHETMESLYEPLLGQDLSSEDFDRLQDASNIKETVQNAFRRKFPGNELKGRNLFYARVNEKLVYNILQNDRKQKRLKILELETESLNQLISPQPDLQIKVGGVVDRIDEVEDHRGRFVRIIDYKTGQVQTNRRYRKSEEEYLAAYFRDSNLKSGFQIYFYTYLYKKIHPQAEVIPGLYSTNKPGRGPNELWERKPVDQDFMEIFEKLLFQLLVEIFDRDKAFNPVEDKSECEYCPYTSICLRHQKKPS